ncbi:putative SN-glycerol-3-phosphate transport system transmembrane component of ABC transporter [Vibrio nigripulchritudo MADA3029]|uniref:carbohydrate ABC transporter permease n=1 Tax=Vibrio nigripulchritudo TaxID=28173 RepID=UPI0003B21E52|nr:carbohydrate ABC transporter permease [Vibrio nigripulchritudo]CCN50705.1 putative SN-glycerol-3-phosphate transport system transmembrane component of ABC transporter [Vibrio nigripulchritudo MADA3020]CCN52276.1 putative SN-glycerol-3-phosphate transport system transmembrane component of ABC transporter [Vibrio nigripulchritudo MADA3021]CCN59162.1 putative SN-glycerol-3-phosphate transport system transmembrane component of ABC transporter [Vibrio nigripulchritudo MADA3029]
MLENTRTINFAARIVLILGAIFVLMPIVIAVLTATQSYEAFLKNGGIHLNLGGHFWQNMETIIHDTQLPGQLWNSVVIAFLVAIIKCTFAFTATFALVFYRSRLNAILFAITIATVMLPLDLIVITTYQVVANIAMPLNWLLNLFGADLMLEKWTGSRPYFEWSLLDTYIGVAAPIATSSTSVFIYRQFFLSLPQDLPKAASMDGAGPLRFMMDILLPLSWTPITATFMFWFIGGWTSYLWPLVAASTPEAQPAIVGLAKLANTDPDRIPDVPLLMTGALFVSFIPVLIIALMQKQIVRGLNLSEK